MWKTWRKYNHEDYRLIFDMHEDSNNPKNLDICRQHIVFQHFPMQRLVENPGTWSVINYKYGQLIAMDLNDIDWIYVIKSGEARVFKYLQPDSIDVKARRRKTQAMLQDQSPFHRKKRILNFVNEREYIKSAYRPSTYRPPTSSRATARSAPPTSSRSQRGAQSARPCVSTSLPATRQGPRQTPGARQSPAAAARKSSSFAQMLAQHDKPDLSLPRLVLDSDDSDLAQRRRPSEVKVRGDSGEVNLEGRHLHNPHQQHQAGAVPPLVIQETVEELPETVSTTRSSHQLQQTRDGATEGSSGTTTTADGASQPPPRVAGLSSSDEHGADEDNSSEHPSHSSAHNNNKPEDSSCLLGSELAAGGGGDRPGSGHRFAERRLSTDMTGGLFDKPMLPGQHGRRRSILVPPHEALAVAAAAASSAASAGGGATSSTSAAGAGRRLSIVEPPSASPAGGPRPRGRSASFLKTPLPGTARSMSPNSRGEKQVIQVGNHTLPAFVQVETLHPGQVFGLRACLDPEERGPSVSLVSGDCEVLQINKKFFMRHCDDAIFSLIRLKNKPFPSEEDLIDRLDVNMQWEEYKKRTLHTFLNECRSARR